MILKANYSFEPTKKTKLMNQLRVSLIAIVLCIANVCTGQVPILTYSINNFGQVQLEIESKADEYYLLTARHEPGLSFESITSMTLGTGSNLFISEPVGAYGQANYKVTAHSIANPDDSDGDGIDDITEFNNMPSQSPLNFADEIPINDGTTALTSAEDYTELAVVSEDIPWAPFLNNREFAKFAIINQETDNPEIYFINSKTHAIHADFLATIPDYQGGATTGEIVFNPNELLPNGAIGSYSFNYSFGSAFSFNYTQRTFELLAANMPYLQNNFVHFIGDIGEADYNNDFKPDYVGSRISVVLESEFFADVDYLPFNQAEGFGFFKLMTLNENPGSRDIVLYEALPNSLPRVGGIITSVVQTPLSHVNLRAIQDNVPNSYIKDPLLIDSIADLLGKYVYYKVDQEGYEIREASLEEVNEWYENIRPTEAQIPERDLSFTEILPLDEIEFEMATAFGAKCSNVATMRSFGFPDGTIPNGFGIPFYYYDEFMKFNGFYPKVESMISDADFISDLQTRIDMLKDFRKEIKDADMPAWMLDSLQEMHDAFPEGTNVRCRSSTNNEDLPGFSGAGLYTSKTQYLDEGHISKSIKQVYASMWNFRAFDERDFYRVDHFIAAMGVLCHPNYQDEKSNGVGVSIDPIYQTANTFYLNTQVGEALITNPEANQIPEEILLNEDPNEGFFVLRYSNLVGANQLVMTEAHLDELRSYLTVIHDEFEILYNVVGAEGFGMDIEYKVTVDDQLIIKQARPWVSFWAEIKSNFDLAAEEIIEPINSSGLGDSELVTVKIGNRGLRDMKDFEIALLLDDQLIETLSVNDELSPQSSGEFQFTTPLDFSMIGDYNLTAIVSHEMDGYSKNDTLRTVVSNLYFLEGELVAEIGSVGCGEEITVKATVTNLGESSFVNTEIEVVVNGMIVDTINYEFNIPYLAEVDIVFSVIDNLVQEGNEITLNLLRVNGVPDAIQSNNSSTITSDLNSDFDFIVLVINADDYPVESSWEIIDESNNETIGSGALSPGDLTVSIEYCVNYNSCYKLIFYDDYSDGICCQFGEGDFSVLSSTGDILVENNGEFGASVEESFCPNGVGCLLLAEADLVNASGENEADGMITVNVLNGTGPYEYSIDAGQNYQTENVFVNLIQGDYEVVVRETTFECTYSETVTLEFDLLDAVNDYSFDQIRLFPNPTANSFIIEMSDVNSTEPLNIEVYNSLGKLMNTRAASLSNGTLSAKVSLLDNASGTYIVKCYNANIEKYYKVIKL